MEPPESPSSPDDHLAVYVRCLTEVNERFGRIAREHRRMAEEWQRLAARLRELAMEDED